MYLVAVVLLLLLLLLLLLVVSFSARPFCLFVGFVGWQQCHACVPVCLAYKSLIAAVPSNAVFLVLPD